MAEPSADLSPLEKRVFERLQRLLLLGDWWRQCQAATPGLKLAQFCQAVKALADRKLIAMGEGLPEPFFCRSDQITPDELETQISAAQFVDDFADREFFGEDFFS